MESSTSFVSADSGALLRYRGPSRDSAAHVRFARARVERGSGYGRSLGVSSLRFEENLNHHVTLTVNRRKTFFFTPLPAGCPRRLIRLISAYESVHNIGSPARGR
jgi:hypothetical protein